MAQTMRFLRQFVSGSGNYVEERHSLLGNPSADEFFTGVHRREAIRNNATVQSPCSTVHRFAKQGRVTSSPPLWLSLR